MESSYSSVLDHHLWNERVLVLYSNSEQNEDYQAMLSEQQSRRGALEERDLVMYHVVQSENGIQCDALSQPQCELLVTSFGLGKEPFEVLLIGKDGGVKLRASKRVSYEDMFGLIDSMPMRRQEMLLQQAL